MTCPQCKSETVTVGSNAKVWITWGIPLLLAAMLGYVIAPRLEPGGLRGIFHLSAAFAVLVGPACVRAVTRAYRCDGCDYRWR